jgi:poly-beta-1,6-N-acetyl-D-glucosamine synthase
MQMVRSGAMNATLPMTQPLSTRYVVITPVRDEEEHLAATIESMVRQRVLPQQWIIVNDGSRDRTGAIIDRYASSYSWITAVHRADRGFRKSGGGVVEAFNAGLAALTVGDWEFIVKFDGDLTFDPGYFASCFTEFAADPYLGVGGGVICYFNQDGSKDFEEAPRFHVRGATKIYRRTCWEAIGGLIAAPGWDTFDEIKANSLGWKTRSFPHLHLLHHRETGAADGNWRTSVKYGRANYICGYHPLFMLCKCLRRVAQKPYFTGAAGLIYGFTTGYLQRIPQAADRATIAYLRREQVNRLWGRETIWR